MRTSFISASVMAAIASAASGQIKVGVVGGVNTAGAQTVNQLNDDTYFDFSATLVDVTDVDTLGEANAFDVILLGGSGYGFDPSYSSAMLGAMRQFVDGGGGVVTTGWYNYLNDQLGGQDATDADYISPIAIAGYSFLYPYPTVNLQNGPHPVTNGLSDFQISAYLTETSLSNDGTATVLGTSSGQSVIVVDDTLAGNTVYLGGLYMANEGGYGNQGMRSGSEDRLLEQACAWAGAVPAPGTAGLLGLAGLAGLRRRR